MKPPALGRVEPYLSVVVTTRNDDHGGDPLKRLQAFVNSFDEQCRRTGLDAEVIVVEWNPPAERPRVRSLLRLPDPPFCTYRFIDVPAEIHDRLRYADVLPLFQMIAKNAGIRRARGTFVLATNIDIIFSTELIDFMASRGLRPGCLYRVDRRDIQPDVPVFAPLEEQMAYCASHQLRTHTRWGSYPVDLDGSFISMGEDVVDGRAVRLGEGWHVREGGETSPCFRWAKDRSQLIVDPETAGMTGALALDCEVESNPYDPQSWVDIEATDGDRMLMRTRVTGRTRLEIRLDEAASSRRIELRAATAEQETRRQLPPFECREDMCFRLYSARLRRVSVEAGRTATAASDDGKPDGGTTPSRWHTRLSGWADAIARGIASIVGERIRGRIVREAPEYQLLEQMLRTSDQQLRELAPMRDLAGLHAFLRNHRPDNLHLNACGDFQLMARKHWMDLGAYPEFETFSMNIDGLFSYIADAAGIEEQALAMPIYHLEHEKGSGWSPEGEAILRRRIAERGITWLDASTVYIWAAYMGWLQRPMMFNGPDWGLGGVELPETAHAPVLGKADR